MYPGMKFETFRQKDSFYFVKCTLMVDGQAGFRVSTLSVEKLLVQGDGKSEHEGRHEENLVLMGSVVDLCKSACSFGAELSTGIDLYSYMPSVKPVSALFYRTQFQYQTKSRRIPFGDLGKLFMPADTSGPEPDAPYCCTGRPNRKV